MFDEDAEDSFEALVCGDTQIVYIKIKGNYLRINRTEDYYENSNTCG